MCASGSRHTTHNSVECKIKYSRNDRIMCDRRHQSQGVQCMLTHSIMWIRATRAETCAKCRGWQSPIRCWRQRRRTLLASEMAHSEMWIRAARGSWRSVTGQSHVSVELHNFACVPFCPLCSLHMLALDMMQSLHKRFVLSAYCVPSTCEVAA